MTFAFLAHMLGATQYCSCAHARCYAIGPCTHARCYAIVLAHMLDATHLVLAHMLDATQLVLAHMLDATQLALAHMLDATQLVLAHMLDATQLVLAHMLDATQLVLAHMLDATQLFMRTRRCYATGPCAQSGIMRHVNQHASKMILFDGAQGWKSVCTEKKNNLEVVHDTEKSIRGCMRRNAMYRSILARIG